MIKIDKREIEKLIEIKGFNQQQVININGQTKTLNSVNFVALCPHCQQVLVQYNQGTPKIEIIKHLMAQKDALKFCIKCGQKLMTPDIIDVETYEEVEVETENERESETNE